MKRTATTILATAVLLLAATGCGDSDSAGKTGADGSFEGSPVPSRNRNSIASGV